MKEKNMNNLFAQHVQKNDNSYINDIFKNSSNPENISFAGGFPDQSLFPSSQLEAAYHTAIEKSKPDIFQYQTTQGLLSLREKIASRMNKNMNMPVNSKNLLLTQGGQQAIDLVAKLILDEGDSIIVEAPTYMGALAAFNTYNPKYYEIPIDAEGMQTDILSKTLAAHPEIKLIYTIPDFQNPTGTTLSKKRRKQMVDLANKYNVLILEDSPYRDLHYDGDQQPPVKYYDSEGRVIFISSFSKILSPALRTGWVFADDEILNQLIDLKSAVDLQSPNVTLAALDIFLEENDIGKHIEKVVDVYRSKRDAMLASIKRYFPAEVHYTKPQGGFFIWVTLPATIDASELLINKVIPQKHVAYVPSNCQFVSGMEKNSFRLNFTGLDQFTIDLGIRKLGSLLSNEVNRIKLQMG